MVTEDKETKILMCVIVGMRVSCRCIGEFRILHRQCQSFVIIGGFHERKKSSDTALEIVNLVDGHARLGAHERWIECQVEVALIRIRT